MRSTGNSIVDGAYYASGSSYKDNSSNFFNAMTNVSGSKWSAGDTSGAYNPAGVLLSYSQNPYNISGGYIGGGVSKFWTTDIQGVGTICGEYIQIKFPNPLNVYSYTLTFGYITPPSNLSVGNITSNSMTLSYTAGSTNGSGLTYYSYTSPTSSTFSSTGTSINLTGLAGSTLYNIYLYGRTTEGLTSSTVSTSGTTTSGAQNNWGTGASYTNGTNTSIVFNATTTIRLTSSQTVTYYMVAGGGSGGYATNPSNGGGGGGGAGGYLTGNVTLSADVSYTITIGTGGVPTGTIGSNGGNSVVSGTGITTLTCVGGGRGGGGGGGTGTPNTSGVYGVSGGSGGGAGYGNNSVQATRNYFTGGSATSGQGYAGGSGYNNYATWAGTMSGGGGGGASSDGSGYNNVYPPTSGSANGGAGVSITMAGGNTLQIGGGGGGGSNGITPSGTTNTCLGIATHGGGNGGFNNSAGVSATANTGGGGGGTGGSAGASGATPGRGGSGVCIFYIPNYVVYTNVLNFINISCTQGYMDFCGNIMYLPTVNKVATINLSTGTIINSSFITPPAGTNNSVSVLIIGSYIYLTSYDAGVIRKYNLSDGSAVNTSWVSFGAGCTDMCTDGTYIYTASTAGNCVFRINISTATYSVFVSLNFIFSIAYNAGYLYVGSYGDGAIYKVKYYIWYNYLSVEFIYRCCYKLIIFQWYKWRLWRSCQSI